MQIKEVFGLYLDLIMSALTRLINGQIIAGRQLTVMAPFPTPSTSYTL